MFSLPGLLGPADFLAIQAGTAFLGGAAFWSSSSSSSLSFSFLAGPPAPDPLALALDAALAALMIGLSSSSSSSSTMKSSKSFDLVALAFAAGFLTGSSSDEARAIDLRFLAGVHLAADFGVDFDLDEEGITSVSESDDRVRTICPAPGEVSSRALDERSLKSPAHQVDHSP